MTSSSISLQDNLTARWRALDPAWRWAIGIYAAGRIFYSVWSVVVALLVPSILQNLDVFGVPVVASFVLSTGERHVFSSVVRGERLMFQRVDDAHVTDSKTSSVWDLQNGSAVSGAYIGTRLEHPAYDAEDLFPYRGVAPEQGWFGLYQRFDVLWYQAIAQNGYGSMVGDIHFPPFYPLLERIVGVMLEGNYFLAGWLISQIALVWSLALLFRIAERWQNVKTAQRTVIFLILFPTAFFFFTAYSESLFLLLSLLAFEMLHQERRAWAGLFVMLAILTRLQGIALLVPLAYSVWTHLRATRRVSFADVLMLLLPLFGGVFYLALRALAGESNVLPTSEPQLNARLVMPWDNVFYAIQTILSGKFLLADSLNLAVTALAILLLVRGWRLLPPIFTLYSVATLIIVSLRYVDTQPLNSMTRYLLTLFPLFLLLAFWSKNRWIERGIVYVSVPLSLYLTAQFLVWGWVA